MTAERFRQVRDLADAALDHPAGERPAFLAGACAGDPALRAEVDSLLAAYDEVRGRRFLETPAALGHGAGATGPAEEEDAAESALVPGERVGAYEIVGDIGSGGMGVVYRAVRADDEYRQVVAVKVMRRGMDTALGQRRFREERQILAGLEHPGIARLLDGGTTADGLPYLVMEHVEGDPIDAYCDHRRLGVAARLQLFLGVCAAVHHAHRSLVVHRDLKPGNVLVTPDGVPKLLDFGIARLVQPPGERAEGDATVTVLRMLTPDYASPEQVRGEPVTTATDVYSLGVLLYELLSGHRPHRAGLPHEVMAAICDVDPERPSASVDRTERRTTGGGAVEVSPATVSGARGLTPLLLRKKLAGDLDTIVLKALRKAPGERYASVEAFAEDVRRHLEGRPVHARPHTVAYRAEKFVRRNPAAVGAAVVAVAALVAGIVATTRQARLADEQRRRAERRFADVRKLANSFLFDFHDAIAPLAGSTPARKMVVERALEYLDSLSGEASGDRALQRELAQAYKRVGDVQGGAFMANLGDHAGALASYRRAIALHEAEAAAGGDPQPLAEAYRALSLAQTLAGDTGAGWESASRGVALSRGMTAGGRTAFGPRLQLATCLMALGYAHYHRGELPAAQSALAEGIQLLDALHAEAPADQKVTTSLASAHWQLAGTLWGKEDVRGAAEEYEKARDLQEALVRAAPDNGHHKRQLAFTLDALGSLLREGDLAQVEPILRRAVDLRQALAQADPRNADAQLNLAFARKNLGVPLTRLGHRLPEARALIDEARTFAETASAGDPANVRLRTLLAESFGARSIVHKEEARLARAPAERLAALREEQAWLKRALAVWQGLKAEGTLPPHAARVVKQVEEVLRETDAQISQLAGVAGAS